MRPSVRVAFPRHCLLMILCLGELAQFFVRAASARFGSACIAAYVLLCCLLAWAHCLAAVLSSAARCASEPVVARGPAVDGHGQLHQHMLHHDVRARRCVVIVSGLLCFGASACKNACLRSGTMLTIGPRTQPGSHLLRCVNLTCARAVIASGLFCTPSRTDTSKPHFGFHPHLPHMRALPGKLLSRAALDSARGSPDRKLRGARGGHALRRSCVRTAEGAVAICALFCCFAALHLQHCSAERHAVMW